MATTKAATKLAAVEDAAAADDELDETPAQRKARKQAELNAAVVTLEWGGQKWTLPKRKGRWPVKAAREFGRDNYLEAVVSLIGEAGWDRLEEVCPLVDDINDFADYAGQKINAECVP